ncbi:hypothetical protein C7458_101471 [Williamsia muralis]|nr:hypothetical protein C7458_101471 [Williamsia marianensis]
MVDSEKSETVGAPTFKELLDKYSVPACGAIISGFSDAFGGGELSGDYTPSTIVSVTQQGDKGTAVTRENGDGEDETIHWLYDGATWRFTCEGVFDQNVTAEIETTTEAPLPTETEEPYEAPLIAGTPCSLDEVGTFSNEGLRCTYMGANGSPRWVTVAPGATEGG